MGREFLDALSFEIFVGRRLDAGIPRLADLFGKRVFADAGWRWNIGRRGGERGQEGKSGQDSTGHGSHLSALNTRPTDDLLQLQVAVVTQTAALVLSVGVEATLAAILAHVSGWSSRLPAALAASLGTVATHPFVWRCVEILSDVVGYWPALAGMELTAVVIESIAYRILATATFGRALALSAAANSLSLAVGLSLYRFGFA